jgi:glucose-1-phosphate thymidylyltransferase
MMISCVEEIAFRMGYIDGEQLRRLAYALRGNQYGDYLMQLIDEINSAGDWWSA